MKELSSTSFGYLIAFLLPGLLGLYALTFWLPAIGVVLQPILSATATVGPSVMLLLISVGMGLCVSSARHFLLAKLLYGKILKYDCLPTDLYKVTDATRLAWHKTLAEEHYRYHQFYGGCFVALALMFIGWLVHDGHYYFNKQLVLMSIAFISAELLLERSAADAHNQYVKKCKAIVSESKEIKQA